MSDNPPSGLSHCWIIRAVIGSAAVSSAISIADDVRAVEFCLFSLSEALLKKEMTVVVSFTDWTLALCCDEKLKPSKSSKSDCLPPRRQITDPSTLEILCIELVYRAEMR